MTGQEAAKAMQAIEDLSRELLRADAERSYWQRRYAAAQDELERIRACYVDVLRQLTDRT